MVSQRKKRASAADTVLLLLLQLSIADGASTISSVATSSPSPPLREGSAFTVTWAYAEDGNTPLTTGDLRAYGITLERCASSSSSSSGNGSSGEDCECPADGAADLAVSLCDNVCFDSDGSYDVAVPSDTVPGDYLVRVSLMADATGVFACSSSFAVQEPEEGEEPALTVEGAVAPSIEVFEGTAFVGAAFTAHWIYQDGTEEEVGGVGEEEERGAAGDFAVDLYSCEDGACADGR